MEPTNEISSFYDKNCGLPNMYRLTNRRTEAWELEGLSSPRHRARLSLHLIQSGPIITKTTKVITTMMLLKKTKQNKKQLI